MKKSKRIKIPDAEKWPEGEGWRSHILRSGQPIHNRLIICIPSRGTIRMEFALARFGQVIPTNWSHTDMIEWFTDWSPVGYLVADARNACVQACVEKDAQWVMFIDDDVLLHPFTFVKMNDVIRNKSCPVMSGLYFTKSIPPEPLIYRGRGKSYYQDWKEGDVVHVDGVPMGCTLIHGDILKAMWEESEQYRIGNRVLRRVFETPTKMWYDPETGGINAKTGTEDLTWCSRVMEEKFLEKAGWGDWAKKHPEYPFLVDTSIFCQHIDPQGRQYPGPGFTFDHGVKPLTKPRGVI